MMSDNEKKVQRTKERITSLVCPCSVNNLIPDSMSHTLSVLSCDPDTTFFPSRVMAHVVTCVFQQLIFEWWWWVRMRTKYKETEREDYRIGVPLQCKQFDPRFCVPHLEIIWSWHNFLSISSDGTRENLCVSLSTIIFELWWWVRTKSKKKRMLPHWCALIMLTIQSQIPCPTPWVCYHMILTQLSSHLEW